MCMPEYVCLLFSWLRTLPAHTPHTLAESERNRTDSTNCLAAWSGVKGGFLPSVPMPPDPGQHRSRQQGDGPLSPALNKVNTFL